MPDWGALLSPSVPLLELIVRGTIVYLAVVTMVRIAGQREAGGLGITDLLVVVLVAEAASTGLAGDATAITDGLVVIATIIAWSVVIDAIAYRSPWFARVVKAAPKPLVVHGEPRRRAMRRELMTDDELLVQLRLHGIEHLEEVKRACLEPNGLVSVIRKDTDDPEAAEDRPPTAI